MKITKKLLMTAALLAAAIAPIGAIGTANAADCGGTTTLKNACSVTKVTASKTGMVRVKLTKPATIGEAGWWSISGSGRMVGFALVGDWAGGPVLMISRTSSTYGSELAAHFTDQDLQIPAGRYRLYVLADGAPVTVTLRLGGLPTGTVALSAPAISGYQLRDVPMRRSTSDRVLAGGVSGSLSRPGVLIRTLHVSTSPTDIANLSTCVWKGSAAPAAATAEPRCPGGDEDEVGQTNVGAEALIPTGPVTVDGPPAGMAAVDWGIGAGTHGQGGYVLSNSTALSAKALAAWLPL